MAKDTKASSSPPGERSLDLYLEAARRRHAIASDRALCTELGLKPTAVAQWRTGRAWPSDDAMVRLADLAHIDAAQALIDLNIWRSDGEAKKAYRELASRLARVSTALVLCQSPALGTGKVRFTRLNVPDAWKISLGIKRK